MDCLNCDAENIRDYPMCPNCETSCHLTNHANCRCDTCWNDRVVTARADRAALAAIAWEEELKLQYGWPVQATA